MKIYTVIVANMYNYTFLHPLMWMFFCLKCVKFVLFFFFFFILEDYTRADVVAFIDIKSWTKFLAIVDMTYF